MLGYKDSLVFFLPRSDHFLKFTDPTMIQICRWFIQNDHIERFYRNTCAGDLLLFTTRQFKYTSVHQRTERMPVNRLIDPSFNLIGIHAEVLTAERKLTGCIVPTCLDSFLNVVCDTSIPFTETLPDSSPS